MQDMSNEWYIDEITKMVSRITRPDYLEIIYCFVKAI